MKKRIFYFWYSASYVYAVKFVRWHRMRMSTGGADSNKLGVGMIGGSDLLTRTPGYYTSELPRIDHGCVRGQMAIRPYTELYYTYGDAMKRQRAVRRPSLEHVARLIRRRELYRRNKAV